MQKFSIHLVALGLLFTGIASVQAADSSEVSIDPMPAVTGHINLGVPGVLVDQATRPKNPLNLEDPEQVAHALGVTLTGDKKQVIYVMEMSSPDADGRTVKREIPIRVDNIREGANMIRQWQSPSAGCC